eukprot:1143819-Pelagomonas_calceolata.AAC.1
MVGVVRFEKETGERACLANRPVNLPLGGSVVFWGAVQMGTSIGEHSFRPHQELPSLKRRAFLYCLHLSTITIFDVPEGIADLQTSSEFVVGLSMKAVPDGDRGHGAAAWRPQAGSWAGCLYII